jgi:hypothetical protein
MLCGTVLVLVLEHQFLGHTKLPLNGSDGFFHRRRQLQAGVGPNCDLRGWRDMWSFTSAQNLRCFGPPLRA